MKLNKLKFLFLLLFLFSVTSFVCAENTGKRGLEIKYPPLNGIEIGTSTTISEYAVYFFSLFLIIAAIAAFVVFTYGGIRYLLSFNNPTVMKDSRIWIYSGAIGLCIALASYLILSTINPEIVAPNIQDIEPTSGIYLKNNQEEEYYVSDSKNNLSFNANSLEFISDEEELLSVFVCSKGTFDKDESEEIKNDGGTHSINNVKSIYFLWHKPGVYLYTKTGQNDPPLFLQTSSNNLKDYDNEIKSIMIKDQGDEFSYLAILFSDPNFEGENGIGAANSDGFKINNVKNSVSSVDISNVVPINQSSSGGSVTFYDDIECAKKKENGHLKEVKAGSDSPGGSSLSQFNKFGKSVTFSSWDVMSFKIEGNCWVIFNTENNFSGRSHIFKGEGCYPSLKGSYVYLPHPEDKRKPKIATVFCRP